MAQRFAELLVSSSRRSIVARVLVRSCSPVRPTSHASTIARELRSPVQSIASKRTASIRGSGFPEPRSDSSGRYEPCLLKPCGQATAVELPEDMLGYWCFDFV